MTPAVALRLVNFLVKDFAAHGSAKICETTTCISIGSQKKLATNEINVRRFGITNILIG
jgi:hypothetical protein